MPLQDSTNKQTRSPRRDVKDVLGRRSRDRGEGLSTLTPKVNDNSTLNRVLRESARQSPERQLLRRRLFWRGLRENEVDGDGNCQFRAIADQLYGSSDRYAEVRANIVEHLRSNSSRYSAFVPDSYDTYIEKVGRDGTWGDHLTLQAASNVYRLEIRVYTSYDRNWERVIRPTDDGDIRGTPIQLSFYAELHYNSVYPNTDEDLSKNEEEETKMTSNDDWTIYVLKCKQRKWYVGKTRKLSGRIVQHFCSNGSAWTRKYPPIKVHDRHRNCTARDEDKYTKEMMNKYGIDNVRGGSYCQIELDEHQRMTLRRESNATHDKCHNCGKSGHFAAQCPLDSFSEEEEEEDLEYTVCDCGDEFESERAFKRHEKDCYYCSRDYRANQKEFFGTVGSVFGSTATHLFTSLQGTKSKGAHIFDTGARTCSCGKDISSRPANHTQCLTCYRRSQNKSESEDEEYERECRSCGGDISNRPRLGGDRCPECPKSGGSELCPKCSPLNFCFLMEHGNSSDDAISKGMCPKCSSHNFCRDTGHGNSEESPAHKSSCVKCSPEYFGCMEDPKAFRNPGNTRA
ncbi:unnamed protein product [Bathycoccus prasinos]